MSLRRRSRSSLPFFTFWKFADEIKITVLMKRKVFVESRIMVENMMALEKKIMAEKKMMAEKRMRRKRRMWMMMSPWTVVGVTWSGSATTQLMEEKISLNRGNTDSLDTWPGGKVGSRAR